MLANHFAIPSEISGPSVGNILNSLRFNGTTNQYLSRTFAAPTSNFVWTLSLWIKRGKQVAADDALFGATDGGGAIYFTTGDLLKFYKGSYVAQSTKTFRDYASHYHLVFVSNGTTVKGYVNGDPVEFISYTGTLNAINSAVSHWLGIRPVTPTASRMDGYLSRICFVDGQNLQPSTFGAIDANGQWSSLSVADIKNNVGVWGNNGFLLDFADGASTTTLGLDSSGLAHNWTLTNMVRAAGVTDCWLQDTPTLNFATFNQNWKDSAVTFSNGALDYSITSAAANTVRNSGCTIAVGAGKWYWEVTATTVPAPSTSGNFIGAKLETSPQTNTGQNGPSGAYCYGMNGNKYNGSSASTTYGATFTSGDIISVKLDLDNDTIEFLKNGVSQGVAFTGIAAGNYTPIIGLFTNTASLTMAGSINLGQRSFVHALPSGFSPINTANILEGVVATSGSYTGNGNSGQNGPYIWMNGVPDTFVINGTDYVGTASMDSLAGGAKITTSTVINVSGTVYNWTATGTLVFKYANAQVNE